MTRSPNRTFASSRQRHGLARAAIAVALIALAATTARADRRLFTYSYETTTMPAGMFEYEQWVTWKTDKDIDSDFDRIEFRHEIEWGITDNWQLALYLSDWRYTDGDSVEDDGVEWRDAAIETIYSFTDPTADPIGIAAYGEFKGGPELLEIEGKLLLQKNIDQWVFVYNATIEAEWEGDGYHEEKGKFEQTFGVSYQFSPKLSVGAELLHEIEFPEWDDTGEHVVYLGPNVSASFGKWWVAVTPLVQVTDVDEEANFQTRLIFGIFF